MRRFSLFLVILLNLSVAAACGSSFQTNDSESSNACNHVSKYIELSQSPEGLLISAEFESTDVNFSEPIIFTIFALNPSPSIISESITIRLNGMHLANPLVATLLAHKTVTEYPINLEVQPGETICNSFKVDVDTYRSIGTGNYNLYFVEAADHLDHMNLSGPLEITILAPETIAIGQNLQYQVEVHNPTNNTIYDISVHELHLHFKEFIPVLTPGGTVSFTHSLSSSKYQNSHITGVTVMSETDENGSDFASTIIEVEGYFEK